jgi:diaminohydroxyphosphoribosylaminopyrimidine deaminase/5-amino-6-(5-phosphoribosylamino)uracil reductase
VQLLVEGGAHVVGSLHDLGVVDRYVLYVAPAFVGGPGGLPALAGQATPTIGGLWRGRFESVERVGDDLRIDVVPPAPGTDHTTPHRKETH